MWRSLASENVECPILVKMASETLVARLKDPRTFDSITKDFKYSAFTFFIHITVFSAILYKPTKVKDKYESLRLIYSWRKD